MVGLKSRPPHDHNLDAAGLQSVESGTLVPPHDMAYTLGEFEVLILLAILHLQDAAYAPAIRVEIERRAKRDVARGAVYVTLDRLEAKGLLGSRLANDAGAGRPRRFYRVSPKGLRALRRALAAVERMRVGLEPLLNER
jgi:PadR family transcriptional regulator, regulatory protein PadR